MSKSKFSSVFQAQQSSVPESDEPVSLKTTEQSESKAEELTFAPPDSSTNSAEQTLLAPAATPRVNDTVVATGVSRGKKGNPNFAQVTAYIRKDTYNKARIALLQAGGDRDFSELMEDLLINFLKAQESNKT